MRRTTIAATTSAAIAIVTLTSVALADGNTPQPGLPASHIAQSEPTAVPGPSDQAGVAQHDATAHTHGDAEVARTIVKEIQADAGAYAAAHGSQFFQELAKGQHPRATVITCSDSRVHTNLLDKTPEGDLFMVRNIGNQLETAKGSVEYGVNHLASSLLIFLGHSSCGAIKAASGDYSALEPSIRKELDTIKIAKGVSNIDGVTTNVNNQVAAAVAEWGPQVKNGQLLVVGAVYDFADDMHQGAGRLNIINVNGVTDPAHIATALKAK